VVKGFTFESMNSNTLGVKAHAHLQANESAENINLFEKKSEYLLHLDQTL
jgi:hypothetical protein